MEEFIEGREFTVLVTEPRPGEDEPWALKALEFRFPAGETWKHFDLKWTDHQSMTAVPVADPSLDERLRAAARGTFMALGADGYHRFDLRMDASGTIFLLESNAYPSCFYVAGQFGSDDFILQHEPGGHRGFLEHLIDRALARRDRTVRRFRREFDRDGGFGLVARGPSPPARSCCGARSSRRPW